MEEKWNQWSNGDVSLQPKRICEVCLSALSPGEIYSVDKPRLHTILPPSSPRLCHYYIYKMAERRQATSSSSSNHVTSRGVRRNLFHQHLSRRPTTSSTSTSAETLRLDIEPESGTSDIVIRDKNGDFQIGDPPLQSLDEQEEGAQGEAHEDESKFFH